MAERVYSASQPMERPGPFPWLKKASWGAIFAGTFMALVSQVTLSVLGAAVGLSSVDLTRQGLRHLGVGTMIWWIISAIIAMFIGGWVAGRLANTASRVDNALHGLVAWALTVVVSLVLLGGTLGALGGMAVNTGLPQQAVAQAGGPETQATQPSGERVEKGARIAGAAAWGAFAMLILGAAAAFFGGMITLVGYPQEPQEPAGKDYPATPAPPAGHPEDLPRTPPPTV